MTFIGVAIAAVAVRGDIQLTPRLVIRRSAAVARRVYAISSDQSLAHPAVEIRGDNITVDFQEATLQGTTPATQPNERHGLGLLIHGRNVTVKNLKVRGYKVGLMAKDCPGLKIVNSDFSYNWKQHLASTLDKEDESDWQSYHHNEKDEWLEYGAGLYLRGCSGFEVRGCRAVGGQCGLMLTGCDKGFVWNNDFSFLSGIGLGMYRSSDNRIMHNKIDWCVRGFSYGVYNRGQDSAGILIYEQSNRNTFAYNSVTHGGDGFFLWAGQTTMDSGAGGCNDNLLYGNDFSHAPTNGIEATFSRNKFVNNLVLECWHGVWGGYSYNTPVVGNVFGYNVDAIAWEHGQDDYVRGNIFYRDNTVMRIWQNPGQDPNWGYPKHHDTENRDWLVAGNSFVEIPGSVLDYQNGSNFTLGPNRYLGVHGFANIRGPLTNFNSAEAKSIQSAESTTAERRATVGPKHYPTMAAGFKSQENMLTNVLPDISPLARGRTYVDPTEFNTNWNPLRYKRGVPITIGTRPAGRRIAPIPAEALAYAPKPIAGGQDPFLKPNALRGWKYLIVDEWGPYDFQRPILWAREDLNPGITGRYTRKRFEVLGPKGRWRLISKPAGVELSAKSGTVPGSVDVSIPTGGVTNVAIELEYVGAATVDYRGVATPAGKSVRFGYSKFFTPIDWTIRFYKWSKSENPAEPHSNPDAAAFEDALKGEPLAELKRDRLEFAGSSFDRVTGNDHFATVADGTFTIQPGDYTLELTTDDGARLSLDGKPLIEDAWHYQGPTLYTRNVHLGAGPHKLHVVHFQIDGYAALKVNLRPKK